MTRAKTTDPAEFDPPDLHDSTDEQFWRSLTTDDLLDEIAEQMATVTEDGMVDLIQQALLTISADIMDRAEDQARCGKVDECRATAVFLTWLAWNVDTVPTGPMR